MVVMGKERDYIVHDDENIKGFFGEYRWLSNYHLSPIEYEGLIYPSTEHAYQAAKSLSESERKEFINLSCNVARLRGQEVDLRADWEVIKYRVMYDIVQHKFDTNSELQKLLLDTGDKYLEETNHWGDTYYGVCDGVGENNLGKILMTIREKSHRYFIFYRDTQGWMRSTIHNLPLTKIWIDSTNWIDDEAGEMVRDRVEVPCKHIKLK